LVACKPKAAALLVDPMSLDPKIFGDFMDENG
jgi:hypothetical protein